MKAATRRWFVAVAEDGFPQLGCADLEDIAMKFARGTVVPKDTLRDPNTSGTFRIAHVFDGQDADLIDTLVRVCDELSGGFEIRTRLDMLIRACWQAASEPVATVRTA